MLSLFPGTNNTYNTFDLNGTDASVQHKELFNIHRAHVMRVIRERHRRTGGDNHNMWDLG